MKQNDSRELSLEESQEINEMMKQNQRQSKPKKSAKRIKADEEVDNAYKAMKKLLKMRTKSELIEIVWSYGVQLREFQEVCKQLLEENESLKASNNGEKFKEVSNA